MKIRIEKKSKDSYLLFLGDEKEVHGKYLSKSDFKKLKNTINEMSEYNQDVAGEDI